MWTAHRSAMREDGEVTPLLRGRPTAGEAGGGATAVQRPALHEGLPDGNNSKNRYGSRGEQPAPLSQARWRPLLLAVAAVGAAVLMVAVGLMSSSGQAASPQVGGASLAATAPSTRQESSRGSGRAGADAAAEEGEAVGAGIGGRDAGVGERESESGRAPGGGWRAQADRLTGDGCHEILNCSSTCCCCIVQHESFHICTHVHS